jgi:hypothetical protein
MRGTIRFLSGILLLAGTPAFAQVAATATDSKSMVKPYGTVEMRHHLNTYYDEQGFYHHQEPSTHGRVQLGAQLYDGRIDFYGTLGAYKRPATQQIQQRKPELALDAYPVKSDYVTLLVYNILQFPVRNDDYLEEEERGYTGEGTTYIFGVSPTVKFRSLMQVPRIDVKFGFDGWTKLYSRKQYTNEYTYDYEDEERRGAALTDDGQEAADQEDIEDTAMHYKLQGFVGTTLAHASLRDLSVDLTTHYESDFRPVYERQENESVDYHYGVDRFSFYKIRLNWEISPRLSFANDFFHYYDGLFDEKRTGDERRFRNVARLTCKL